MFRSASGWGCYECQHELLSVGFACKLGLCGQVDNDRCARVRWDRCSIWLTTFEVFSIVNRLSLSAGGFLCFLAFAPIVPSERLREGEGGGEGEVFSYLHHSPHYLLHLLVVLHLD